MEILSQINLFLLLLACLIILCASAVQTMFGFGLALIAVPLLMLIDPKMVPAPIVIIAAIQLSVTTYQYWHDINWQMLKLALIARIPGTLLAMFFISYFGELVIKLGIALAVLIAVVVSLCKIRAEPNQTNHIIAGFLCGITGTAAGIGGPPIALIYQHQQGDMIRANLSGFFLVGSIISLVAMSLVGYVSSSSYWYALAFLPCTLIGIVIGRQLKKYVKPHIMRTAILILCSLSSIAVILTLI